MSSAVSILPSQWDNTRPAEEAFPGYINPHVLAKLRGDLKVWAVYQELVYLSRGYNLGGGWFYRAIDAIKNKLYLSAYAVRCAIRQLEELKFIKTEIRRVNRTPYLHFRVLPQSATTAPEGKPTPFDHRSPHSSTVEACTLRQPKGNKKIEIRREKEEENTAVVEADCGWGSPPLRPEEESGDGSGKKTGEFSMAPKTKSVASVTQLDLSKITAPKKVPKTTEELYRLFCREYGKRFDGAYPETMTVKVRKHIAAIKGIFGEDTPRFFELVMKNWADASAYVANRTTGLSPVKTPSLGFIRTGTNLMHFKTWWDDFMADVIAPPAKLPAWVSSGPTGDSEPFEGPEMEVVPIKFDLFDPNSNPGFDPDDCEVIPVKFDLFDPDSDPGFDPDDCEVIHPTPLW